MLGSLSAYAQSLGSGNDSGNQGTQRTILLFGGSYQQLDDSGEGNACNGSCVVENPVTGDCTCANGWTPIPSARALVDVAQPPLICGSFFTICVR
jgi:hypothetical protein